MTKLEKFLEAEKCNMYDNLQEIVSSLKHDIEIDPKEYTERGCDEPAIDIRLCVEFYNGESSWIFRTGSADFDQVHSEYCAASCVGLYTNTNGLLNELIEQILEQE